MLTEFFTGCKKKLPNKLDPVNLVSIDIEFSLAQFTIFINFVSQIIFEKIGK